MNLFDPNPRSALEFLPPRQDLPSLRAAAQDCRGCDLYQEATQVVLGEGHAPASIFLSAILRMPEPEAKEEEIASLVNDLKVAAAYAREHRR